MLDPAAPAKALLDTSDPTIQALLLLISLLVGGVIWLAKVLKEKDKMIMDLLSGVNEGRERVATFMELNHKILNRIEDVLKQWSS